MKFLGNGGRLKKGLLIASKFYKVLNIKTHKNIIPNYIPQK